MGEQGGQIVTSCGPGHQFINNNVTDGSTLEGNLTWGNIFFFLFAAALGPEKSFSRAARAALAFATFLLGPAPRNFCPSTSTWPNTNKIDQILIQPGFMLKSYVIALHE